MKTALRVEGEITKDGHLLVELPAQLPRGPVLVTLEPMAEEDFALKEEDLKGAGLTAEEIALSPEIGLTERSARVAAWWVAVARDPSYNYCYGAQGQSPCTSPLLS